MITVLNCIAIISLILLVYSKYGREFPRIFWLALPYKIGMGLALGWVYLYYYTANDTWIFFQDANVLADFGRGDMEGFLKFMLADSATDELANQLINSQERSLFLIKIMSVFSMAGGNNYWISATWFSVISFLAAWYLFIVVVRLFENSWMAAACSFLFFPSIVFWSSGLIKETMALSGIYFISGLFLKSTFKQKSIWVEWILALCALWVAWSLKYYWTALFGAVLFTYVVVFVLSKKSSFVYRSKIITWIITFALLCGVVSLLHPNFYPSRFLEVLITNHNDFVRISDDDGLIHFYQLQASWASVLLNTPWALFSGLLRPFVWESTGLMSLLASLENVVITLLLISAVRRVFQVNTNRLLLLSVILYITSLCVFLALSTPNLGTLSRYRVGFLPFLIFIITYRNPLFTYFSTRIKFLQT